MEIIHVNSCHPESWKMRLSDGFRSLGHDVTDWDQEKPPRSRPPCELLMWSHHQNRQVTIIPDVAVSLDLFWSRPTRERAIRESPFFRAPFVFTADGGHEELWREAGVNHHWMPPATTLHPAKPPALIPEVVFVGLWEEHPSRHRRLMRKWLEANEIPVTVIGPSARELWGEELREAIQGRVLLSDTMGIPRYWSNRLPTMMAVGGTVVQPDIPGLAETGHVHGENILLFEPYDFDTMGGLLTPDAGISRAAVNLVASQHTWTHRAQQILDTVGAS